MEFYTAYNHPTAKDVGYTHSGDSVQISYIESVDERGQPCLKESGVINLVELHQQGRDLCDIKQMILRFQRGDLNALNQRECFFADVADLPNTPQEVSRLAIEAKAMFMRLSAEERSKFGNSLSKWLSGVASMQPEALATLGIKPKDNESAESAAKPDVKPAEHAVKPDVQPVEIS